MNDFNFTGPGRPAGQELVPTTAAALARPSLARRAADLVGPVILPTAVLVAARWWNTEGAMHSIGDAFVPGVFCAGSLLVGWVSASNSAHLSKGAAVGFTLAGTLAAAGVVAYSGGMALPVLLWTVSAGLASKLASLARAAEQLYQQRLAEAEAARRAEDERRELLAASLHERRMQRASLESRTTVVVEALRTYGQVSVAELDASARVAVAELAAGTAHAALSGMNRAALPPTERPALAAYLASSMASPDDDDRWLRELSAG
jgi:hypothetical protein